jgi:hypothetical protein
VPQRPLERRLHLHRPELRDGEIGVLDRGGALVRVVVERSPASSRRAISALDTLPRQSRSLSARMRRSLRACERVSIKANRALLDSSSPTAAYPLELSSRARYP